MSNEEESQHTETPGVQLVGSFMHFGFKNVCDLHFKIHEIDIPVLSIPV